MFLKQIGLKACRPAWGKGGGAMPAIRVIATAADGTEVEYPSIAEAAHSIADVNMLFKTRLNHLRVAIDSGATVDTRKWRRVGDQAQAAPVVVTDPALPREGKYIFPDDANELFRGKAIRWIENPVRFRANDLLEVIGGITNTSISLRALIVAQPAFFGAHQETHRFYGQGSQPALVLTIDATLAFIGMLNNATVKAFRRTTLTRFETAIRGEMVPQPAPAPTIRAKINVIRTRVDAPHDSVTFANVNAAALSVFPASGFSAVHTRVRAAKAIETGEAFAGFTWRNATTDTGRRRNISLCGGIVVPADAGAGGAGAGAAEPELEAAAEEVAEPEAEPEEEAEPEVVAAAEEEAEPEVEAAAEEEPEVEAAAEEAAEPEVAAAEEGESSTQVATVTPTGNNLVDSFTTEHGRQIITEMRTSDGFINATRMCKAGGKKWFDYMRGDETQKFMVALKAGYPAFKNLVISQHGGKHAGTWVHPQVAAHLATWISPEFAVAVSRLVVRYTSGQITTEESSAAMAAHCDRLAVVADAPPQTALAQTLTPRETRVMLRRGQLSPVDVIKGLGLCSNDEEIALELVEGQKYMVSSQFMESHVMYLCITNLKIPGLPNRLVLKIGYTADFVSRMDTLRTEYKCEMMMCGIVPIRNEQFEKSFHKMLVERFPHAACCVKIGGTMKDELYMCDRGILNEFFALAGSTPPQNITSSRELAVRQLPIEALLSKEETKRAVETTKQVEAEAGASARVAEANVKKAEIELEMLKLRIAHSITV